MYKFRNIDSFKPGAFERIGMLKGKRWYTDYSDINHIATGLFKPKDLNLEIEKFFVQITMGNLLVIY